ncbi:PP2C family protein-serine/threonine phosphatase [Ostreiculturibacter nitratireducens]|uniref:PP2C family protein-serine/threonine phosphatase n=1 Tax=Ostreiculturibacter nitratireducens TaxID=3075226 RepID=UPI0031B621B5
MKIRFSASTHVGKVRKVNEDSILTMPEQGIWAVSDGMGGYSAGDFASQCVVDNIAMLPSGLPPGDLIRELRTAISRAHESILTEATNRGAGIIGATVVVLVVAEGHFAGFWAGDSRLYRLQSGSIELLTSDHSLVGALVEAGELTWDEAERHAQSNVVTRAVGVDGALELDKIRGEVFPGDRFLLCSDGLSKYANFSTLERVLRSEPIETVADTLQQIALDGGGADNISVIVIDVI